MALTSAMSYWWSQEEGAPQPEQVGVPFWALEAIVTGFLNYHDKVKTGESAHLDREMGFVSDGKGKKPRLVEKLRRHRDLNASLAIALDRESGLSTTDAVKAASTRFLISEKTVWRLWSKNKDFAIKSLENFRTLTTSRGAEIDPES